MQTKILDYRIVIQPDQETGTGKMAYTAYCPTLGVVDDGKTVEEAKRNIKGAIEAYLADLIKQGKTIPEDHPDRDITAIAHITIDLDTYAETSSNRAPTR